MQLWPYKSWPCKPGHQSPRRATLAIKVLAVQARPYCRPPYHPVPSTPSGFLLAPLSTTQQIPGVCEHRRVAHPTFNTTTSPLPQQSYATTQDYPCLPSNPQREWQRPRDKPILGDDVRPAFFNMTTVPATASFASVHTTSSMTLQECVGGHADRLTDLILISRATGS